MNPGEQISRYRIQRALGQGGMGIVYLAQDTRLNRPVALKFLPAGSLDDRDKQRFLNEARAAAVIRHPNICAVYDIEEADSRLFISMAYLEGETLAKRLARGLLPVQDAVGIAIQILRGLDKAHSLGIVHRDIKSNNIIVGFDGHVSILDFGLALLPGAERLTQGGGTIGTLAYMSPEQYDGEVVDTRTDIWSTGVVLYEMLTGELPFGRRNAAAISHAILAEPTPPIERLRPDAPTELRNVVEKALAKKPAGRWRSAHAMESALKPFGPDTRTSRTEMETMTVGPAAPGAPRAVPNGHSRKRRLQLVALACGLALLASLGLYFYSRSGAPGSPPESRSTPATPSAEKLIAVLPFEILGSSAETVDVANGVTEILTAALADFERFGQKVVAVPSSEIRRRNINSAAEAKRIYGANWVVTGTAQPLGGKIQFALALVDPAGPRQLAAKVFEYDPADPIGAGTRAIDGLAALLSVGPDSARRASTSGGTATPAASGAYLKGRGFLARYDVAGNLDLAIAQLQRAVESDDNFSLAHAALAEALWRKSRAAGDVQLSASALRHGERAVQLDPQLPTVHTILGTIYSTSGRENDAIRELKEALQLAPGYAEATRGLAGVYAAQGRFAEAEAAYRQAIAARPTDWYGYLMLGLLCNQLERYDDSIAAFTQARELTPDNELIYRNIGISYMLAGQYDKAVAELQRSLKLKANATTYASLGSAYFRQRRYADAVAAVETAIDLDPKRYYFWGNLGIYCKWSPGSEGRSRTALEKAIELAGSFLLVSPREYSVRADLGEYYARQGNKAAALAQIDQIPESARRALMNRIATVYELTGNRAKAIPLLAATLKNPATWRQIQDNPDLAALWSDPALQKLLVPKR